MVGGEDSGRIFFEGVVSVLGVVAEMRVEEVEVEGGGMMLMLLVTSWVLGVWAVEPVAVEWLRLWDWGAVRRGSRSAICGSVEVVVVIVEVAVVPDWAAGIAASAAGLLELP